MPRNDTMLRDKARHPRREPTEAEKRLWQVLRDRQLGGAHFRRQHAIPPHVADFACVDARLIVQLDTPPRADSAPEAQRDAYFQRLGWRVLRCSNAAVLADLDDVRVRILEALEPPSTPAATAAEALPRATGLVAADAVPAETVTLAYDDRHRRRLRLATDGGRAFLLDLAEARVLRDGDVLGLDDDSAVLVRAAAESVLDIQAADALALARIAWHLGNRHTPTQILDGALRIRADHVLEHLLTDHLGALVTRATAPFDPEGGAYGHAAPHAH